MKKISMLGPALFFTLCSFAQRSNVEFGIKGGVNISNYDVNTTGSRTGFHLGALAHIPTQNSRLGIQPEIVFSTQGAKFPDGMEKIDYVNIPILLQYLGRGGLRLETGPQVGVVASAKFNNNNGVEYNVKNDFQPTDLAWAFGMGFISSSGLGFDARFNLGLSDITKGREEVHNRVWQLGIFYQFPGR